MFGLLVALITRPATWLWAAFNGTVVGATCAILFALLLGWVIFMLAGEAKSTATVRLLARQLWPADDQVNDDVEKQLLDQFPRLRNMPLDQRADYLNSRVFADAIASGPSVWFAVALVACILGAPIAIGTVIAQVLVDRGHRWWFLLPRYLVAWISLTVGATILAALAGGGKFNGKDFSELSMTKQILLLSAFPLLTYLVMRRWQQPRSR